MVQLDLDAEFLCQVLEWYDIVVPMKDQIDFLVQLDLTNCDILEVVMHTEEQASTKEATEIVVKTLDSTYEKSVLDKVAAAEVHLNKNQHKKLLSPLT